MLSRADARGRIESLLRFASIAVLTWLLWHSLDRGRPESIMHARSASLSSAIRDWSTAGLAPDHIAVQLDSTPTPIQRDWLAALRSSGSKVTWSGDLPAAAVTSAAVVSPRGGLTVLVASPRGAAVKLSDDIGVLDTAAAGVGGARFTLPSATGGIRAIAGNTIAHTYLPDSVQIRRLLVIGSAGWESKFVVAALEEDGWKVDAEMRVAPGVTVTQGSLGPIDTGRYSAVIALDGSAAARASDIKRYVSSGGGLILAGPAGMTDAFSALRPGAAGRMQSGVVLASELEPTTLRSLPLVPVIALRNDAIALERRDGVIAGAARRYDAGRVLQQGYAETWRWRLGGGDASLARHRAWWSSKVASVAYAPLSGKTGVESGDNAPLARLVASLGRASSGQSSSLSAVVGSVSLWWLFAILSFCLLAEWTLRRLRGLR